MEPQTENDYRREQSFLMEQLVRITDFPSHKCYPIVGRMRKFYGYEHTLSVLKEIQCGKNLSYIIGALRKNAHSKVDITKFADQLSGE